MARWLWNGDGARWLGASLPHPGARQWTPFSLIIRTSIVSSAMVIIFIRIVVFTKHAALSSGGIGRARYEIGAASSTRR